MGKVFGAASLFLFVMGTAGCGVSSQQALTGSGEDIDIVICLDASGNECSD